MQLGESLRSPFMVHDFSRLRDLQENKQMSKIGIDLTFQLYQKDEDQIFLYDKHECIRLKMSIEVKEKIIRYSSTLKKDISMLAIKLQEWSLINDDDGKYIHLGDFTFAGTCLSPEYDDYFLKQKQGLTEETVRQEICQEKYCQKQEESSQQQFYGVESLDGEIVRIQHNQYLKGVEVLLTLVKVQIIKTSKIILIYFYETDYKNNKNTIRLSKLLNFTNLSIINNRNKIYIFTHESKIYEQKLDCFITISAFKLHQSSFLVEKLIVVVQGIRCVSEDCQRYIIGDQTGSIELFVWTKYQYHPKLSIDEIVLIENVDLKEAQSVFLTTNNSSCIGQSKDFDENCQQKKVELEQWWNNRKEPINLTKFLIELENNVNYASVFRINARINKIISTNIFYKTCLNCQNFKKITNFCLKCNKRDTFYIFYFKAEIVNHEETQLMSIFNNAGQKIFNMTANQFQKKEEKLQQNLIENSLVFYTMTIYMDGKQWVIEDVQEI